MNVIESKIAIPKRKILKILVSKIHTIVYKNWGDIKKM